MKFLAQTLAVSFLLQVAFSRVLQNDEKHLVQEFLNYVATLNEITHTKSVHSSKYAVVRALDEHFDNKQQSKINAPLKQYFNDLAQLGATLGEKQLLLNKCWSMFDTINTASASLAYKSYYDRLESDLTKFEDDRAAKILSASNYLRSQLSLEGIAENKALFDLLNLYQTDRNNQYQHLERIMALKQ